MGLPSDVFHGVPELLPSLLLPRLGPARPRRRVSVAPRSGARAGRGQYPVLMVAPELLGKLLQQPLAEGYRLDLAYRHHRHLTTHLRGLAHPLLRPRRSLR